MLVRIICLAVVVASVEAFGARMLASQQNYPNFYSAQHRPARWEKLTGLPKGERDNELAATGNAMKSHKRKINTRDGNFHKPALAHSETFASRGEYGVAQRGGGQDRDDHVRVVRESGKHVFVPRVMPARGHGDSGQPVREANMMIAVHSPLAKLYRRLHDLYPKNSYWPKRHSGHNILSRQPRRPRSYILKVRPREVPRRAFTQKALLEHRATQNRKLGEMHYFSRGFGSRASADSSGSVEDKDSFHENRHSDPKASQVGERFYFSPGFRGHISADSGVLENADSYEGYPPSEDIYRSVDENSRSSEEVTSIRSLWHNLRHWLESEYHITEVKQPKERAIEMPKGYSALFEDSVEDMTLFSPGASTSTASRETPAEETQAASGDESTSLERSVDISDSTARHSSEDLQDSIYEPIEDTEAPLSDVSSSSASSKTPERKVQSESASLEKSAENAEKPLENSAHSLLEESTDQVTKLLSTAALTSQEAPVGMMQSASADDSASLQKSAATTSQEAPFEMVQSASADDSASLQKSAAATTSQEAPFEMVQSASADDSASLQKSAAATTSQEAPFEMVQSASADDSASLQKSAAATTSQEAPFEMVQSASADDSASLQKSAAATTSQEAPFEMVQSASADDSASLQKSEDDLQERLDRAAGRNIESLAAPVNDIEGALGAKARTKSTKYVKAEPEMKPRSGERSNKKSKEERILNSSYNSVSTASQMTFLAKELGITEDDGITSATTNSVEDPGISKEIVDVLWAGSDKKLVDTVNPALTAPHEIPSQDADGISAGSSEDLGEEKVQLSAVAFSPLIETGTEDLGRRPEAEDLIDVTANPLVVAPTAPYVAELFDDDGLSARPAEIPTEERVKRADRVLATSHEMLVTDTDQISDDAIGDLTRKSAIRTAPAFVAVLEMPNPNSDTLSDGDSTNKKTKRVTLLVASREENSNKDKSDDIFAAGAKEYRQALLDLPGEGSLDIITNQISGERGVSNEQSKMTFHSSGKNLVDETQIASAANAKVSEQSNTPADDTTEVSDGSPDSNPIRASQGEPVKLSQDLSTDKVVFLPSSHETPTEDADKVSDEYRGHASEMHLATMDVKSKENDGTRTELGISGQDRERTLDETLPVKPAERTPMSGQDINERSEDAAKFSAGELEALQEDTMNPLEKLPRPSSEEVEIVSADARAFSPSGETSTEDTEDASSAAIESHALNLMKHLKTVLTSLL